MPFSRVSSQPRDWTQVSHIAGMFFYHLSSQGSPRSSKELEYRQWLFKRLYANLPITPPRNLSAPHDNECWRIYDHLFSSDSSFSPSPKLSCYSLRRVGWYLVYSYTAEGGYSSESLQNQKVFFPGEESQNLRTKTANNFKGQVCLA